MNNNVAVLLNNSNLKNVFSLDENPMSLGYLLFSLTGK